MELPEDVARELDELFGADDVPSDAVTVNQLSVERGGSTTVWAFRLRKLIAEGKWARGRRAGSQAYWYWKVRKDERKD